MGWVGLDEARVSAVREGIRAQGRLGCGMWRVEPLLHPEAWFQIPSFYRSFLRWVKGKVGLHLKWQLSASTVSKCVFLVSYL